MLEHTVALVGRKREQGHGGAKLHVVSRAEDRVQGPSLDPQHRGGRVRLPLLAAAGGVVGRSRPRAWRQGAGGSALSGRLSAARAPVIIPAMQRETMPASATVGAESGDAARLTLTGDWTLAAPLPDVGALVGEIARLGSIQQVKLDASALGRWDSVLPAFLFELATAARAKGAVLVADGAPEGLRRLLAIALAVPPRTDGVCRRAPAVPRADRTCHPTLVGRRRRRGHFIGEVILALLAFLRGRAKFRIEDVARVFYAAGPAALPIVTLIGLLAGIHPGVHRRQRARAVRGTDLRRQPGHDRHGAGDGAADGGRDHGRPHRRRVRRRARHDAGQPGDRRAAHARGRPGPVPGGAADAGADADAAAARLLRDPDGHPGRRHRRRGRVRHRSAGVRRSRCA